MNAGPAVPMTVTSYRGTPSHQSDLGELDPRDDDGFARLLGPWTRQVCFRPGDQVAGTPAGSCPVPHPLRNARDLPAAGGCPTRQLTWHR